MFGLVDTSHTPALGYMEVVDRRDAATLLPIIQAHTALGTIIHSEEWSSYRRVASLPNVAAHGAVNHSLHFVDPTTGVHTQNVESYWGRVKRKIKHMKGCHATEIPSYLAMMNSCGGRGLVNQKSLLQEHLPGYRGILSSFNREVQSISGSTLIEALNLHISKLMASTYGTFYLLDFVFIHT